MKKYKQVFKDIFCGYIKLVVWELIIGFVIINMLAVWYILQFVLKNVPVFEIGGLMCVMFAVVAAKVYSS